MNFFDLLCYQVPTLLALAFFQALEAPPDLTKWGTGGLAVLMFWFYREDRKRSEEAMKELGKDFREVVEENTRVIATLVEQRSHKDKSNA